MYFLRIARISRRTDRAKLLHYGKIADKHNPRGFGDCGFVVVFQHRPPNNSIPILHADQSQVDRAVPST